VVNLNAPVRPAIDEPRVPSLYQLRLTPTQVQVETQYLLITQQKQVI